MNHSEEQRPGVSVVVPTYRRPEALTKTLRALESVSYPRERLEIVVVDDAADADTRRVVQSATRGSARVEYIEGAGRGAAAARNRGGRAAGGELLLLCDDDIVVAPTHIELHLETQRRYGAAVVGGVWEIAPWLREEWERSPFGRYRIALDGRFRDEVEEESLGGGCSRATVLPACDISLSKKLFIDLGGFDEEFPHAGMEDQEFSLRVRASGCELIRNHAIRTLHNDRWLDLEGFCTREERSAQTAVVMARRHPDRAEQIGIVRENRPVRRTDPPRLVAKKLAKRALTGGLSLAILRRGVGVLEAVRAPDHVLTRAYNLLVGLHIFRGVRTAWRRGS